MLALTGTATPEVYNSVVKRLCLKDPVVVGMSPDHENIKYCIEPLLSVKKFCELFAEKIHCYHMECPKTTLRTLLGDEFVEPPGYEDFHKYRLIDMYTQVISDEMKKKVLESFMTKGGKLRLLIATSAFSMGVDCPDIHNIIRFGPPSSVVQYVQESGRGGRNGNASVELLLCENPRKNLNRCMKMYSTNSTEC